MGALGAINSTTSVYTASETDVELQNSGKFSGTAAGTDTYTVSFTPAVAGYSSGQRFFVIFTNANTGAATINVNGLGAKALTKNGATALASGDIAAGQAYAISYDGTRFQILGKISAGGGTVATASELNTGTDNVKYASALALQGSKYLDQSGAKISATASGTNTYTATIAPALTSYPSVGRFFIKFTNTNTGAATINLNGLGAKAITKNGTDALVSNDITAGQVILLAYDGTQFQIIGKQDGIHSMFLQGVDGGVIPGYTGTRSEYGYVSGINTSVHLGGAANQIMTRLYVFDIPENFGSFKDLMVGSYRFGATDSMTVTLKKIPAFPFAAGAAGTNDSTINGLNILPVANDTHELFTFVPGSTYSPGDKVSVLINSQVDSGEYAEISFVELNYYTK